MKNLNTQIMVIAGCMFATASMAQAGTVYSTNTAYLDRTDSPFASELGSPTFWIEDFEDGLLNSLGANATYNGSILGPSNSSTDSVDGDGSGLIDGLGVDGHSLFVVDGIRVDFDGDLLGQLPTFVGLVWTDGYAPDEIVFEAFDADGDSLGVARKHLGDNVFAGTTDEDRFFGVTFGGGISAISMFREGVSGFEVDHLQYGFAEGLQVVPVPPAAGLGAAGLIMMIIRRRRKN